MPLNFIYYFRHLYRKFTALVLSLLFGGILIESTANNSSLKIIAYLINYVFVFMILEIIYWIAKKSYHPDFIRNEIKRKLTMGEAIVQGLRGGKMADCL